MTERGKRKTSETRGWGNWRATRAVPFGGFLGGEVTITKRG